jgi:FHA domain
VALSAAHLVGRSHGSGLRLDAAFVSTAHALLLWRDDGWQVQDLCSRNGTYLEGERLISGLPTALTRDARLSFGDVSETWTLSCDRPPTPVVLPLDNGDPCFFADGLVAVPSPLDPVATIYPLEGGWILERADSQLPLLPGERFEAAGRWWQFECPGAATPTLRSLDGLRSLDETTLELGVSRDEEHVTLTIRSDRWAQDLGARSGFYLLLVLARKRLSDRGTAPEPGWIDIGSLPRFAPEYANYSLLNVEVHRLRRLLADAGIRDAARVIERRRGQIRLGTDRVELLTETN